MTTVIEVRGVQPTPKEGRAAVKAWPVVRRWANLPVLFLGGALLATLGLALAVLLPAPGTAILGFALVGLGLLLLAGVCAALRWGVAARVAAGLGAALVGGRGAVQAGIYGHRLHQRHRGLPAPGPPA